MNYRIIPCLALVCMAGHAAFAALVGNESVSDERAKGHHTGLNQDAFTAETRHATRQSYADLLKSKHNKNYLLTEAMKILGLNPRSKGELSLKKVDAVYYALRIDFALNAPQIQHILIPPLSKARHLLATALTGGTVSENEILSSSILPMAGISEFIDFTYGRLSNLKQGIYNTRYSAEDNKEMLERKLAGQDAAVTTFYAQWSTLCKGIDRPKNEARWKRKAHNLYQGIATPVIKQLMQELNDNADKHNKAFMLKSGFGNWLTDIKKSIDELYDGLEVLRAKKQGGEFDDLETLEDHIKLVIINNDELQKYFQPVGKASSLVILFRDDKYTEAADYLENNNLSVAELASAVVELTSDMRPAVLDNIQTLERILEKIAYRLHAAGGQEAQTAFEGVKEIGALMDKYIAHTNANVETES